MAVARRLLSLARVSVEVWTGHARDIAPRLVEEVGERSIGFMFFDHRGLTPGQDLHLMERYGLVAGHARLMLGAIRPLTAPLLGGLALAEPLPQVWALPDALQHDVEDFMLVVDAPLPSPPFPEDPKDVHARGGRGGGLAALAKAWRPGLDEDAVAANERRQEGFEATRV